MNKKALPLLVIVAVLIVGVVALVMKAPKTTQPVPPPSITIQPTAIPTPATELERAGFEGRLASKAVIGVTDTGFKPADITVVPGTQVQWMNQTDATVNVSSANHPTHTIYPALNLGNFEAGQSVTLTFDMEGEYKYHNHLVPSQTGVIKVVKE